MVTGCDHIGIQVRDVERSARFYEEHLGFERVARWSKSEPYVQRVVGYHPDVTLEIVLLAIPGSTVFLEILEYRGVDKQPVDPATANPGTGHFCLFVDDLDDLYARLLAHGVEFVSEVERSTAGPIEGGKLVYMKDPDGIRVELVELP
jgi:catechol 2,3-dioxygenase-like lactoylglutathione lyase family enzyme